MTVIRLAAGLFAAAMMLSGAARAQEDAYRAFLQDYVVQGGTPGLTLVRYGAVTEADHAALKGWIAGQAALDPAAMGRDEAFAFWVNLYNAMTLDIVLDHYPVASIRDIRFGFGLRAGPWREGLVTVNGEQMSLDQIEHGVLRTDWDEPRVHFAVNCASIGCPALAPEPYTGEDLDAQLDAAVRAYVNSDRGVAVQGDGRLVLSAIFQWYRGDFGDSEEEVIKYLARFADDGLKQRLETSPGVAGYEYDWSLNDAAGDWVGDWAGEQDAP